MFRIALQVILTFLSLSTVAQLTYVEDQSIPVSDEKGNILSIPWSGGLNAAQFSKIDLDGDGKEDLVAYDRMANKVIPYLNIDNNWKYAPDYEVLFPEDITNWMLLVDFNCDGKKDIFTGDIMGMKVYRNTTEASGPIRWKRVYFYSPGLRSIPLLSKGTAGKIPLTLRFDDLPALVDADNDGDLDIFTVRFNASTVEYHRNYSKERYGICDSLDFERVSRNWGDFSQCKCESFSYDGGDCTSPSGKELHASGKALLAMDIDNDNDHELFYSEADCSNIFMLKNGGNINTPIIEPAVAFPLTGKIDMNTFPSAFYEDVDFDGIKDIIATPNVYRRDFVEQDFKSSTWLYKNVGTNELPDFMLLKKNFLQDEMIDVGDNSVPAFWDEDKDGDQDLFISYIVGQNGFASIAFYRNIGTSVSPHFQLVTYDYNNISSLRLINIKCQFADVNADSKTDLTFMATDESSNTLLYYIHQNKNGEFDLSEILKVDMQLSSIDNYHLTHINHDGYIDLLIGRFVGNLEFYLNGKYTDYLIFQLQNSAYLGINSSVSRQSIACYAVDLDNDGNDDLILSDQEGRIGVIDDFHNVTIDAERREIFFNQTLNRYQSIKLGRVWPTAALLFDSKRPAIVTGNIRGGIEIFRNEDNALAFEELIVRVYPNPITGSDILKVESNMRLGLTIFDAVGKKVYGPVEIGSGINNIPLSLSKGLYLLRFESGRSLTARRLIVH